MHKDGDGKAGPDGDGRLDLQLPLHHLLAGPPDPLSDVLRPFLPQGRDKSPRRHIPGWEARPDGQNARQHDGAQEAALRTLPSMALALGVSRGVDVWGVDGSSAMPRSPRPTRMGRRAPFSVPTPPARGRVGRDGCLGVGWVWRHRACKRGRVVPPSRPGARRRVRAPHGRGGCQARDRAAPSTASRACCRAARRSTWLPPGAVPPQRARL